MNNKKKFWWSWQKYMLCVMVMPNYHRSLNSGTLSRDPTKLFYSGPSYIQVAQVTPWPKLQTLGPSVFATWAVIEKLGHQFSRKKIIDWIWFDLIFFGFQIWNPGFFLDFLAYCKFSLKNFGFLDEMGQRAWPKLHL